MKASRSTISFCMTVVVAAILCDAVILYLFTRLKRWHVQVEILQADKQVYVACIDDKLLMKIGIGTYQAESNWREEDSGKRWKIWLK